MTALAIRPVRWGIVATGAIAARFTADLRATADAEVVAVVSRSAARARAFADEHGVAAAYDDLDAMLASQRPDVVYVATPHPQHVGPARAALEAGVAVLCEKPLAADPADARALVDLARAREVFLAEAMWLRCHPLVVEARTLVASGAIGQLRAVTADLGFPATFDPSGRLWSPELGGGALLDVGVYPLAFARAFLPAAPELVEVTGSLASTGVDAEATLRLEADGVTLTLGCSIVTRLASTGRLTGTTGELRFDAPLFDPPRRTWHRPSARRWWRHRRAQVREATRDPAVPGFAYEIAEVHACLRAGRTESALLPLDETLEVLALLDDARRRLGAR